MFFIIFGNRSKVVPVGQIYDTVCPICQNRTMLDVHRKYDYFHLFYLPIVKYNSKYFAFCSSCGSVYEMSAEHGKAVKKGALTALEPGNLQLLKSNYRPHCSSCGAQQSDNGLYCSQCGEKL